MILMGECRTRLANYEGNVDDEIRLLKNKVNNSLQRKLLTDSSLSPSWSNYLVGMK